MRHSGAGWVRLVLVGGLFGLSRMWGVRVQLGARGGGPVLPVLRVGRFWGPRFGLRVGLRFPFEGPGF